MFGNWSLLYDETTKPYFSEIFNQITKETEKGKEITPHRSLLFNAFKSLPLEQVKVVVLGQDPYPTQGVANGLAFAVNSTVSVPHSLNNIFKELSSDFQTTQQPDKTLLPWAKQGFRIVQENL